MASCLDALLKIHVEYANWSDGRAMFSAVRCNVLAEYLSEARTQMDMKYLIGADQWLRTHFAINPKAGKGAFGILIDDIESRQGIVTAERSRPRIQKGTSCVDINRTFPKSLVLHCFLSIHLSISAFTV